MFSPSRCLVLALSLQLCACKDFDQWVRILRYTPIMAPSTEFAPGSLVRITNKDKFEGEVICAPEGVLGADFVPKVSSTVSIANTKQKSQTIKFKVDTASLAGGNVDIHAIRSIKAVVTNPKIYYVTHQMVLDNLLNISNRCLFALETLRGYDKYVNADITMVASVIQADASYTVEWDDKAGLDVSAKIAQLENIAAELHLDCSRVGHTSIAAKGVYWGIKDNAYLAYLVNPAIIRQVPPDTRLIAPTDAEVLKGPPTGQVPSASDKASRRKSKVLPVAPPQVAADLAQQELDASALDASDPDFADKVLGWLPAQTPVGPVDPVDDPSSGSDPSSDTDADANDPADPTHSPTDATADGQPAPTADEESAPADDATPPPPPANPRRRSGARTPPHLRDL